MAVRVREVIAPEDGGQRATDSGRAEHVANLWDRWKDVVPEAL